MFKSLFAIYFALFTFNAIACVGGKGYLPPNNMFIPVGAKNAGGITQIQFNEVIDKVYEVYSPIIRQKGASLKINRLWIRIKLLLSKISSSSNVKVFPQA